jgi:hypothetical protein
MSEFNFGSLATTQATSSVQRRLKPWDIYNVKFSGARIDTVQGKKDPSKSYTILKVRFDGEDGYYEESIFFPKEGDDIRPTYKNKEGHDYQGASSFDRTMTFIAQVASVLNPEGFAKMQAASAKFKSFDDVANAFIKITDKAKGKETKLKLTGRTQQDGTVQACLPKFVAINKQGERFTCDNFLGEKVFFSANEELRRKEYLNATPTTMGSARSEANDFGVDTASAGSEEIDFDSLL